MSIQTFGINDLLKVVDRASTIVGSYGHARTTPERVSAMTRAALQAEHIMQELIGFTKFLYQTAPNGKLLHVYPTGQIAPKVYTPWRGTTSLTRKQKDIVRAWLWLKADAHLKPPYIYSPDTKKWYVDLKLYADEAAALQWLERHRISAGELLNLLPYPT